MAGLDPQVILDESRKLVSFRLKADQLNVWELVKRLLTAGNELNKVRVVYVT